MGDSLGVVRASVAQAASVFLDREATVRKAVGLIEEAGEAGADVIVFPEGFIPGHPLWYHFHAATSQAALEMAAELFRNAIVIGGSDTDALAEATRRAGVWAVIGMCEKQGDTTGTMWNSAAYFGPDGAIVRVHRKLTPTLGERLVHTGGGSEGLEAVQAPFGRISSLICAENSNPLLTFSGFAQYAVLHAALWPSHFSPTQPRMSEVIANSARTIAYQGACYVLNAAGSITSEAAARVANTETDLKWLHDSRNVGGSCIVAPSGEIIAGPMESGEGLLYGELDLDRLINKRVIHDYAGHYNRADLLTLAVEPTASPLFQAPWLPRACVNRPSEEGESGTSDVMSADSDIPDGS